MRHIPTKLIIKEFIPTGETIHLFGKYFYNKRFKTLLIGDKTAKQAIKEIEEVKKKSVDK